MRDRTNPTRRSSLLAAALGLLLLVASATPGHAAARPTEDKPLVTFGIGPSGPTRPDPRPYLAYGLGRGGTVTDHVAIFNQSNQAIDLVVYPSDGVNEQSGGLSVRKRADRNQDVGAWVTLGGEAATTRPVLSGRSQVKVHVPPQSAKSGVGLVVLPVRITVPTDAEPGDHVGGISASLITVGSSKTAQNLELEQRVVTRLYINVGGALAPKLAVRVLGTSYRGGSGLGLSGTVRVRYRVSNVGNARLGATTRLHLRGPFGLGNKTVDGARVDELVPGGSAVVETDIDGVAPTVLAWADIKVEAFRPPGAGKLSPTSATATARVWVITWQEVVLLVLLAFLIGGTLLRRRRPRAEPAKAGRHVRRRGTGETTSSLVGVR